MAAIRMQRISKAILLFLQVNQHLVSGEESVALSILHDHRFRRQLFVHICSTLTLSQLTRHKYLPDPQEAFYRLACEVV